MDAACALQPPLYYEWHGSPYLGAAHGKRLEGLGQRVQAHVVCACLCVCACACMCAPLLTFRCRLTWCVHASVRVCACACMCAPLLTFWCRLTWCVHASVCVCVCVHVLACVHLCSHFGVLVRACYCVLMPSQRARVRACTRVHMQFEMQGMHICRAPCVDLSALVPTQCACAHAI